MRMSNFVGNMKNKFNNEKIIGADKTRDKDQNKYDKQRENCAGTYRIRMPLLRHFIDPCVVGTAGKSPSS